MENRFQHFFARNYQFIMTFSIVQWILGMLVVLGGHPENIGGGYWSFPRQCWIAEVMRPKFIILRRLCADKTIF